MYCFSESSAAFAAAFDSSRLAALLFLANPLACCLAASRFSLSFSTCALSVTCRWFRRSCLAVTLFLRLLQLRFLLAQCLPRAEDAQQRVRLVVLLVGIYRRAQRRARHCGRSLHAPPAGA